MYIIFFSCASTYTALETLTEPHQVLATLQCLTAVSRELLSGGHGRWVRREGEKRVGLLGFYVCSPFLRYPEGKKHLFSILTHALPGIDSNDFRKTLVRVRLSGALLWYSVLHSFTVYFVAGFWVADHCSSYHGPPGRQQQLHRQQQLQHDRGGCGCFARTFPCRLILCWCLCAGWERAVLPHLQFWGFHGDLSGQVKMNLVAFVYSWLVD